MNTRIMFKYIERIRCKYIVQCIIFLFTFMSYTQTDTIPAYHYFTKADSLLTQRKLDNAIVYFKKALPIYEKAKAWERMAKCYDKISDIYYINNDYDLAIKYQTEALDLKLKFFGENSLEVADSYEIIGNSFINKLEHNNAMQFQKKTLKIRENRLGKFNKSVGMSYFNIALIHYRKEEYKKALSYIEKSLTIRKRLYGENHIRISDCHNLIARILRQQGEYDQAIHYLEKRFPILISNYGKEHEIIISTLNDLAVAYKNKGYYDLALTFYRKALKIGGIIEKQKLNVNFSYIYNNIGIVFKYKGEYEKSLNHLKKGTIENLKFYGEKHPRLGIGYNNIGNLYMHIGDYDESLKYYTKSLSLRKKILKEDHSDIADSYNDIGNLFLVKKEYEKALFYLKKALKIRESIFGQFHPDVADSYEGLGEVYLNKNDFTLSFQNYQKSWDVRLKVFGEHHPEVSLSYNNLAELYREQSNFEKALINYQKAIDANTILNKKNQYFDYNILLTTLQGQAKTYQAIYKQNKGISDLNSVIYTYQKADAIINQLRQSFTNYQDKVRFSKTAKEIYQGAIATQLLRYDIEKNPKSLVQAFYYAERSKANTLKELLNDANAKNFTGLPNKVVELEKELRIDQAFYQSQITKELSSKKTDSVKVTNYESRLFDTSRRQDSLTEVLENNYPKYYQLKHENKLVSLSDIQQQLPKNKTLVEFFTSDSITYAFTISKNTLSVEELAIPKLEKQLEKFRKAVLSKDIKNYKTVGYDLYTQLIAPIKDQLVAQELIIIPDGPLWHLNFELLLTHDDNSNNPKELSYLLKEYAISYGNSANLLFNTSNNNQKTKKREECLAFSFSDSTNVIDSDSMTLATLRDAGDDLPGTRKEIKAISEIIDGQYYYGSEAIEANFKKNAGRFNILHLALHGEVDNERPENSKLYFTKSKDTLEDNLLYGHELFALDIPAELTVLSACNTGTGKIAKGEGIMSLGSAFQYAGTKSLLLSSWEVSDQTTPELMRYFYSNLKQGMNKAKALQQAKLQYLQTANINRTHPFYWGGFYLVGDSAPIRFDDNSILYWILGILFLIVLSVWLFLYRRNRQ